MGKLVRDRIPEIIKADGKNPITRIIPEDEYLQVLDIKTIRSQNGKEEYAF